MFVGNTYLSITDFIILVLSYLINPEHIRSCHKIQNGTNTNENDLHNIMYNKVW